MSTHTLRMDRPRASSFGSFNSYRNERPRASSLSFVSFQRYYTSDIHTKMAGAPANLALHVDEAERGRDGHLGGAGAGGMETSQSMHSVCSTTSPTSSNLQPLTPQRAWTATATSGRCSRNRPNSTTTPSSRT